ncbi:hypothetical protein DFH08DRAFT_942564 [Mycena albidolilacea]|uniref:Myb/SANT-like domain-containing protein n=1 Tax=Mycena albidolilacea TaxID=1033008 RepID=A0AAD6ZE07_9AGAR|nr:hypothetical protein DFH08DRAFT_942564 [Mycena albidolilacea]
MAPGGQPCDWTADPGNRTALVAYFKTIKDKIGQGGSWDQPSLESAAAHMVSRGPPAKGAPKNASSVKGVWAGMKKIHDALVLVMQKRYPGASGWTYDQQAGFSVCDDNHEAWKEFSKQHTVFKLFANKGWELFDNVRDILPTRARGINVFNPAVATATPSQDSDGGPQLYLSESYNFPEPSQILDNSQSQSFAGYWSQMQSQPLTDWSQTQFQPLTDWSQTQSQPLTDWSQVPFGAGDSAQPIASTPSTTSNTHLPTPVPDVRGPAHTLIPATSTNAVKATAPPVPGTPSSGVKRSASDEFQTPWTAKRGKTTGADVLLSMGGSVDRVGNAIRDCFMPQKSSVVSPTKQLERARQMALDDQEAGNLMSRERAMLNLIFTRDTKAADAYVAEKTLEGRTALAEILIKKF